MTEAEIVAIEERCAKATQGPWFAFTWNPDTAGWQIGTGRCRLREGWCYGDIASIAFYQSRADHDGGPLISDAQEASMKADANFIAASRTDVPTLVAEVRRLRAVLRHVIEGDQGWNFAGDKSLADIARAALQEEVPNE